MNCANCGHSEELHGQKLCTPLCPVDFPDGGCTGPGKLELKPSVLGIEALAQYMLARAKRKYSPTRSNPAPHYSTSLDNYRIVAKGSAEELIKGYGRVCGCLKFVAKEGASEEAQTPQSA